VSIVTLPKIAGLEYWVQLLFNFTLASERQVKIGPNSFVGKRSNSLRPLSQEAGIWNKNPG